MLIARPATANTNYGTRMKPVSEVHFRVIDHGIFLPIALRLAREAAKVSYWSPWEKPFPSLSDMIGDGFAEIERVNSDRQDKESVDCWVFPDIGFSDMQLDLLNEGRVVWGARDADSLEISRGKFLKTLATTDLPVAPHTVIQGMTNLCNHLRDKGDKWIKLSKYRGDWETFHFRSWKEDEVELDYRAVTLGPWKELVTFYVFDEIPTTNEDGCDSYCIDGRFPATIIHGMEAKDKAYLGTFQPFSELPEEVRRVNDEFGPILGRYGYRSFFSTEVRITEDGQSYFIDPTCRAGSPPSQVMCEMIGNLGDIIWQGAQGELVEPEQAHRFGVQALVSLKAGRSRWSSLTIPNDVDQWFKSGFCSRINGALWFPTDKDAVAGEVGWMTGVGDTAQEAIDHLKSNVEALPSGTHCDVFSIAELIQQVNEADDKGMEFTSQEMPEPAIVLEEP